MFLPLIYRRYMGKDYLLYHDSCLSRRQFSPCCLWTTNSPNLRKLSFRLLLLSRRKASSLWLYEACALMSAFALYLHSCLLLNLFTLSTHRQNNSIWMIKIPVLQWLRWQKSAKGIASSSLSEADDKDYQSDSLKNLITFFFQATHVLFHLLCAQVLSMFSGWLAGFF